jgi:nicotinamidase/pyrazinamidase
MNALILVDIQNDFVPGGALAVPEGDRIVPIANEIQKDFDLIIATQDWHPANHKSFAANHIGRKVGGKIQVEGLDQILWPVHCVEKTFGADFVQCLDRTRWSKIFQKGTDPKIDSYSGFFDNGHRKATGLADFLREKNVDEVFIMGLATDYCVKFTALDAVAEGFKTHLIEDGCRGVNLMPGDVDRAISEMRERGVEILKVENLKKEIL